MNKIMFEPLALRHPSDTHRKATNALHAIECTQQGHLLRGTSPHIHPFMGPFIVSFMGHPYLGTIFSRTGSQHKRSFRVSNIVLGSKESPLMRTNRLKNGFTLVELLVVVAIIALLISLLLPALSKAQRNAKTVQDISNIAMIHKAFLTWSNQDDRGRLPLPGRIARLAVPGLGFVSGQGEENISLNNTANLYASMIQKDFISAKLVVSPIDTNPVVDEKRDYNYNAAQPGAVAPTYWDTSATAGFKANIHQTTVGASNTSYAHLVLVGDRKKFSWSNKADGTRPVMGNRGTYCGALSGNNYQKAYWNQAISPDDTWEGIMCFGDNHTQLEKSMIPDTVQYECGAINLRKDNCYKWDFVGNSCKGMTEGDTWMCIIIGNPSVTMATEAPERLYDGTTPTCQ